MPRKILIETSEFPYHIYNRSNNKDFFYIDRPTLWSISLEVLSLTIMIYQIRVHAFVLMSNHYHLVLDTPLKNLSASMTYFHREIARRSNREAYRVNHFFGGRYKWSLITQEVYYWNILKYIYRNPVKANICKRVEDYRFSSLNSANLNGKVKLHSLFSENTGALALDLGWLNEAFGNEVETAISKGLRRREFKPPSDKSHRRIKLDAVRSKKELGTFI